MKLKNPFIDESALEGEDKPKPSEDEVLMEQAKQHTPIVEVKTYMSLGMVIGLGVGALVGSLMGKLQFGMGIGMLIGLLVGTCIHKKPQQSPDTAPKSTEQAEKAEKPTDEVKENNDK